MARVTGRQFITAMEGDQKGLPLVLDDAYSRAICHLCGERQEIAAPAFPTATGLVCRVCFTDLDRARVNRAIKKATILARQERIRAEAVERRRLRRERHEASHRLARQRYEASRPS